MLSRTIQKIENHLRNFESKGDYRKKIRQVEEEILTSDAGKLIANQAGFQETRSESRSSEFELKEEDE